MPVEAARRLLGDQAIIGFSTHNVNQLEDAVRRSVDYLAFGPIFPTASKENPDPIVGLTKLAQIKNLVGSLPLVAIGGISSEAIREVLMSGADSVAKPAGRSSTPPVGSLGGSPRLRPGRGRGRPPCHVERPPQDRRRPASGGGGRDGDCGRAHLPGRPRHLARNGPAGDLDTDARPLDRGGAVCGRFPRVFPAGTQRFGTRTDDPAAPGRTRADFISTCFCAGWSQTEDPPVALRRVSKLSFG